MAWDYMVSDECGRTPTPGIELPNTAARTDIIVHPRDGFLASIDKKVARDLQLADDAEFGRR